MRLQESSKTILRERSQSENIHKRKTRNYERRTSDYTINMNRTCHHYMFTVELLHKPTYYRLAESVLWSRESLVRYLYNLGQII